MPWPTTFLLTEGAVRTWLNQRPDLVGSNRPIPLGFHLKRLRSPYRGSYVLLSRVGGAPDPGDVNVDQARLSAAVYGTNQTAAATAAAAYANLLVSVTGPVRLVGGTLHAVTDVTGPLYLVDVDEERYLVDAVFHIQPD